MARFFTRLEFLDDAIAKGPERCDFAVDVAPHIQEVASEVYFFSRLDSPRWLTWVLDHHLVRAPDEPVKASDGTLRAPPWAPGPYLASIAGEAPDHVMRVLASFADTRNFGVIRRMLSIAVDVPPELARILTPHVLDWLDDPVPLLGHAVGEFAVHLARGDESRASREILRKLLGVREQNVALQRPSQFHSPPLLLDRWEYEDILERFVPAIVELQGLPAVRLVADVLEEFLRASGRERDDYSTIWLPSLDGGGGHRGDVRESLARTLFSSASAVAHSRSGGLEQCLEMLQDRGPRFFYRVALKLLADAEVGPDDLDHWFLNRSSFQDPGMEPPEYWLLLDSRWTDANHETRSTLVDWLRAGPSPVGEYHDAFEGRWVQGRLSALERHLPDDLVVDLRTASGRETARDSDESVGMLLEEEPHLFPEGISPAEALHSYESGGGDEGADWYSAFRGAATADTESFGRSADLFTSASPEVVEGLLHGVRIGYKVSHPGTWEAVLRLGSEVAERVSAERWRRAGKETASLLRELARTGELIGPLAADAVEVLGTLARQSDVRDERDDVEPFTLAINRADGEALIGLVGVGLQVLKGGSGETLSIEEFRSTLRRVLVQRLNRPPRSVVVHATLGQQFPWLLAIDEEWAREHARVIFPTRTTERVYFDAAWTSYLGYTAAYDSVLPVLLPAYDLAVDRLLEPPPTESSGTDVRSRLGEHLMAFYWRGKLDLRPGGLVSRFFAAAAPEVARHAIEFIGRSVRVQEGELPVEVQQRLLDLWDHRLNIARDEQEGAELGGFASWLVAGKLPPALGLRRFASGLGVSAAPAVSYGIGEYLAQHAETHTREVLTVLMLLVGHTAYWDLEPWSTAVEAAVRAATAEGGDLLVDGEQLLDALGRLGHVHQYRELATLPALSDPQHG